MAALRRTQATLTRRAAGWRPRSPTSPWSGRGADRRCAFLHLSLVKERCENLRSSFLIPLPDQGEGKRRGVCVFFANAVTRG